MLSSLRVSVPWLRTLPPKNALVESALPPEIARPEIVTVGSMPLAGLGLTANTRDVGEVVCWVTLVLRAPAPVMVVFWVMSSSPLVSW